MLFSRILGGVGRAMISIGVLLLLFVAYQLWGTGLRTDQAQTQLGTDFAKQLDDVAKSTGVNMGATGGAGATAEPSPAGVSPAGVSLAELAKDPKVQEYARNKRYRWGDSIGKITIPKIGVDFWMVEGVELSLLAEGPGHFPTTVFPGQAGNSALAGHRTTWKAPFNRIDELSPGDLITVETLQGRFTYEVMRQASGLGNYIVPPSDITILDNKGDNRLTLMACHPKYSASLRIIVTAKLVNNPVEPTPKSSPDDNLTDAQAIQAVGSDEAVRNGTVDALAAGNNESIRPAIYYGLAALFVWLAAMAVGMIWKKAKWPAYLAGLPLFGFLLWHCFEFINRSLPAAY